MNFKPIAVVVTYKPKYDKLYSLILSIEKQVDLIIIVNNGNAEQRLIFDGKLEWYDLKRNYGIAYALNYGISKAIEKGALHILLSDQDSLYPENYFSRMSHYLSEKTIAITPSFKDIITSKIISLNGEKTSQKKIVTVKQAISSGMIINTRLFNKVGGFNNALFIDWVDYEWCWRAINNGFEIYHHQEVVIDHTLGDNFVTFFGFHFNLRSPSRHYYITRNAFYLSIYSKDLNLFAKIKLFICSLRYLIGYPLLSKNFRSNLIAVSFGFYHGLKKQLGEYKFS